MALELNVGRFRIQGERAAGATGTVYEATDPRTGERVAVKLIRGLSPAELGRFEREAQTLAQIHHPDIVRYIDHGRTGDGLAYLVMEWLDGEDLRSRLSRGVLSAHETALLGQKITGALAALHSHRLVHRDLKPGNIFLPGGRIGDAKLVDFGLVRRELADNETDLTATGVVLGTPSYMAPEQARAARNIDSRADLFSLGGVLYRCLAGKPPFEGQHMVAVLTKVLLDEPAPLREARPDVPPPLADLVSRLLSKEPENRPAGAAVVGRTLASLGSLLEAAAPAAGEHSDSGELPTSSQAGLTTHELRVSTILLVGRDVFGRDKPTSLVRSIVQQHGGQVDELLDGTRVVTLTGQGLVTDQAARAAHCALNLYFKLASIPIAVATGRAELGSLSSIGEVIERAAQLLTRRAELMSGGKGFAVAVDGATAALLDASFEIKRSGDDFSLHRWRPTELPGRTLVGRVTPMLGREWELQSIEGFFRDCVDEPAARAVLVTGAPGMGKSRLAHEAALMLAEQHPGLEVWWGRGDPQRTGSPLALLGEVIRSAADTHEGEPEDIRRSGLSARVGAAVSPADAQWVSEMLGEIAGVPFPDDESAVLRAARKDARIMSERLAAAWETFLDAVTSRGPLLIVLSDVHWADPSSIRFVSAALERLAHRPWLILGLARPDVHEVFPRLWEAASVQEVRLRPLSRRTSVELARQVLGDSASESTIERIAARADGNAFYLEEIVRSVAEAKRSGADALPMPETVLGMVQSRIAGFDIETRRMLRAASVFGEVFWTGGVAALLGGTVPRSDVDTLVQREVVVARPDSRFPGERELCFRHALLREGAYSTLTNADRTRGHALAAEWLEQHGEPDAMVIAQHFELAGERARAAALLLRAADQALQTGDTAAAIARAERARPHLKNRSALAHCLFILDKAHGWEMQWDRAVHAADELLAVATPGSAEWSQALNTKVSCGFMTGRMDGTIAAMQAALTTEILPDAEAARSGIALLSVCIQLLCLGAQFAMAAGAMARMDSALQKLPENDLVPRAWAEFAHAYAATFRDSDAWTAWRHARAAMGRAETVHNQELIALLRAVLGMTEGGLGLFDEAERDLRAVESTDPGLSGLIAARFLSVVLLDRGAVPEARALAERWRAKIRNDPRPDSIIREAEWAFTFGEIAAAEGNFAAAEAELSGALPVLAFMPLHWQVAASRLALVRLALGRTEEALALSSEVMAAYAGSGAHGMRSVAVRLARVEVLAAAGQAGEARALLREVCAFIDERAAAIDDAEIARSFLTRVPENARARALAAQWRD